eukprot:CAMPEP_0197264552 /NCGR_PEP_ID=MMETSP1432-20130617/1858_1 /TAXON_ID=44447 /ORGANISM="Pseudo-nitzschia delicatissima, Strain UNC1205" /LENGTH=243 /DNA_ID=CAMNT_0042729203 /DNA_START=150 /DNA_END=881 /DNA_ORIENTATION=-
MFVASDIERDRKANFAAAVVVDDPESEPQAVATSVYGTAAVAKIPIAVATGRSAFELGTVVDTREKRQTELCCGSCCDYIKACIIVDIAFIVSSVISVCFYYLGISALSIVNPGDDDAAFTDFYDDLYDDIYIMETAQETEETLNWMFTNLSILLGRQVACLLFAILGIVGASKFNKWLVLAVGVWYCIDFILSIIYLDIGGSIMRACFAYPHIGLFVALHRGSMTHETYAREQYCCCGGSPR